MENCKAVDTPIATGSSDFMIPFDGKATKEDITLYGSIIGSEMYLAVHTRPDIAYAVSLLSRFLANPSPRHVAAAKRVLQYLQGTKNLGIVYGGDRNDSYTRLHGYCDADYAGDKSTRKSVSGNLYLFAGGVVSSSSKRQQTVSLSTTEAEYYALSKAVAEALWLKRILREMGYTGSDLRSVRLYGNNQGSLSLAENPELHQRTKHIDIKHHFIREHVESGAIDLWYINTTDMAADGLTKPLTPVKHAEFVKLLRMEAISVGK
jgi:hypothetical protein